MCLISEGSPTKIIQINEWCNLVLKKDFFRNKYISDTDTFASTTFRDITLQSSVEDV